MSAREVRGLHREEDRRPPGRAQVVAMVVLGVLAVALGVWLTQITGEVEDQARELPEVVAQRDVAEQSRQDLASRVVAACAEGGEARAKLEAVGACAQAEVVRSAPVPGEPGRPPTAEEIDAAVARWCAAHNGCSGPPPSAAEVAAAVVDYLAANPPAPGRPPTAEEISAAVATWFANNPPPPGPRGPRGAAGPGPTPEEIEAAVAEYLAANPPPAGPRGPAGPTCPTGSTLAPVEFASGETGLGCVTSFPPTTAPSETPPPTTGTAPPTTEDEDP
ncbi:MAG TPA: hypothetical protein VKZ81_28845 [Pseudonocardia sp.]|uniref:hypothetical protein n=1 Tax=Pseudonocardia sp. TaxID=60912 RepID=UPI002B4B8E26|nr:hypothetical protein [Pseudonocardia sp.]HLU59488.1 hypothetical protein [Pseudonocardia sp.]